MVEDLFRNLFIYSFTNYLMEIGTIFFVVAAIIIGVWLFVELKGLSHRILAISFILLFVFFYFSYSFVQRNYGPDAEGISGVLEASKIYFSWLGHVFGNIKTITGNVIGMNWTGNHSEIFPEFSTNSTEVPT